MSQGEFGTANMASELYTPQLVACDSSLPLVCKEMRFSMVLSSQYLLHPEVMSAFSMFDEYFLKALPIHASESQ